MINLHERMLPTSAGVEPVTSWSPVGRRIQLSHRGRPYNGLDVAIAASCLAWNNSMANIVDMAVACLIDLATASKSLDKALTGMDSCWRQRYAAEENKSACKLMATNLHAAFSQNSVSNWNGIFSLTRNMLPHV